MSRRSASKSTIRASRASRTSVLASALTIAITASLLTMNAREARADEQLLIKTPGEHPHYFFDAEPHGLLGFGPFRQDLLPGVGFRGTFILVQQGFVPSINNSIGLGVGADFFVPKRGGVAFVLPAVMQWNFWLSTHWAVFGEPGVAVGLGNKDFVSPIFAVGGRFHFNERIALTMRLGYPYVSVGVSFYL
jgi:hypothetical protein